MTSKHNIDKSSAVNVKPNNTGNSEKSITPQSAMDAYFEDMFGSSEDDPLKKLSAQQEAASFNASEFEPQLKHPSKELSQKTALIPKPKLKPKKISQQSVKPLFIEPEPLVNNISPLIIPAAFPKLAPSQADSKHDLALEQKQDHKTQADVKPEAKTKLDAKTALALLEKHKSKLTQAQRQKLEAKLNARQKIKQTTSLLTETEIKTNTKPKIESKVKPETTTETKAKQENALKNKQKETFDEKQVSVIQTQKHPLPEWANHRFECLIFSVAGLKLAVPLISLGAIYKIEKEIKPLVGRADWFIGLYHHLERNVRVIDTAQWVMPERYTDEVRQYYKFIIRLGGNDWGIACDAVHESIQLYPDQVKWRTERTKRAWLFGTVIDHMCALIDADTLSSMLEKQTPKKH